MPYSKGMTASHQAQSPTYNGAYLTENYTSFGEHTAQGEGGYVVAGTSITSGDPSGHFAIISGLLTVSASGEGSLVGPYSLVFDNGDELTVTIIADTYSVSNATELEDAAIDAHTNYAAGNKSILYRATGDYEKADAKNGSYIVFQNLTFTGSLTVLSDRNYGQELTYIRGITCSGINLVNIGCDNVADEDSWIIDETHPSGSGHPDAYYTIPCETTYQIQFTGCSDCTVRRSRFGNKEVDNNPRRAVTCIYVATCGTGMLFEDNIYNGYYRALKVIRTQGFTSRRNLYLNALSDSVFCSTTQSLYVTGPVNCVVEFERMVEPWNVYDFKDAHIDAVQIGTGVDQENYHVEITGVYQDQRGQYVRSQGIWMDDSPPGVEMTGFVRGCFFHVTSRNAIGTWRSNAMVIENNTCLRDNVDFEKSWIRANHTTDLIVRNNICGSVNDDTGNTNLTTSDNVPVDHLAVSGVESYAELFNSDYSAKRSGAAFGVAGWSGHTDFAQNSYEGA